MIERIKSAFDAEDLSEPSRSRSRAHESPSRKEPMTDAPAAELQQDDEAGPADAGRHGKAQEQLKDEVVEASAGGGMVTVKVSRRPRGEGDQIDPRRRSTPRTSSCSRTWCWRPSTRRCARPRSSPNRKLGGLTGGLDLGGLGLPGL